MIPSDYIEVRPEVAAALADHRPIVALETTIMTHGMPQPTGLETARDCEQLVRSQGAVPATIGIRRGKIIVGLEDAELAELANSDKVAKTNLSNLGVVLAGKGYGSCSVSSTLLAAHHAGISVAATGGIGGVHRQFGQVLDISSDITALGRFDVLLVCAGAKAILDVSATREQLETHGVPVIGYQTEWFPLFYSPGRDIPVDVRIEAPDEIPAMLKAHRALKVGAAVLVVTDPPAKEAMPIEQLEDVIASALVEANNLGIAGRELTPFVLGRVREMTDGDSMKANLALIRNNCDLAARVAVSICSDCSN